MADSPIVIRHNFQPGAFHWLWAKYVTGTTAAYHCTNCLRGPYSKRFSAHHPAMASGSVVMDEHPAGSWQAIYLCGVVRAGYPGRNYPHNVHAVIRPHLGQSATWEFETWTMSVDNGVFQVIPAEEDLPKEFRGLPPAFRTCRIFRWAMVEGVALVGRDERSPRLPG